MRVLVLGADGFLGQNVLNEVRSDTALEVASAGRSDVVDYRVDLLDCTSIKDALDRFQPEVLVNCAGIVANTEVAYKNVDFSKNIFEAVLAADGLCSKVIITGSAAEYGVVENVEAPVSEEAPLLAMSDYGKSKVEEEKTALEYARTHDIDVVIARVFNPIGLGMGEKFLLTSLLRQIEEIRSGARSEIAVSRLDSVRDYIDVRDVAAAMHMMITSRTKHSVYNVGSGIVTSNGQLINKLLDHVELGVKPTIIELQNVAEPTYAARADIGRIKSDLGWLPTYDLDTTLEDIVNAESNR